MQVPIAFLRCQPFRVCLWQNYPLNCDHAKNHCEIDPDVDKTPWQSTCGFGWSLCVAGNKNREQPSPRIFGLKSCAALFRLEYHREELDGLPVQTMDLERKPNPPPRTVLCHSKVR